MEQTDDNRRAEGTVGHNPLHDILRAEFGKKNLGIGKHFSWPAPKYPSFFLLARQLQQPVWIAKNRHEKRPGECVKFLRNGVHLREWRNL